MTAVLVVEDGTIVANANTLVSIAELNAYANNIGVTVTGTDVGSYLVRANNILFSYNNVLAGNLITIDQGCPYPRNNLNIKGFAVANNVIPNQAKIAQMEAALSVMKGIDPLAAQTPALSSLSVDVISLNFDTASSTSNHVSLPAFDAALRPLLNANSGNLIRFNVSGSDNVFCTPFWRRPWLV